MALLIYCLGSSQLHHLQLSDKDRHSLCALLCKPKRNVPFSPHSIGHSVQELCHLLVSSPLSLSPKCSSAVLLPDVAGNKGADRGALTADTVSPQIQGAFRQDSGRSSTGSGRQQADILSGAGEPHSSGSHHEDMVKAPEAYR